MQFIVGVIVGIVVATAGFSGIAKILDRGVEAVKTQTQELSK
jgi:hypothetical protein